jgi:Secretion system C-terminal sorting domain
MLIAVISSNGQSNRSIANGPGERIVKTYPVPAISYITIEPVKATNTNYVLVIYNFLGRKMYEKQNFSQKTTIMLDEFTRGVYIYHLTDLTGRLVESGKFQISK